MSTLSTTTIDEQRLNELLGQAVGEIGATVNAALIVIGDRAGLYRALAESGPLDASQLAKRTGTTERYVREWLAAQAASGYLAYDPATERYTISPSRPRCSPTIPAPPSSPAPSSSPSARWPTWTASTRRSDRRRHGLARARTRRCSRAASASSARLSRQPARRWLPALDGVHEARAAARRVADVGCGHGASTILMAQAFPPSRSSASTTTPPSIERAQRRGAGGRLSAIASLRGGRRQGLSRATATIWSRASIACTTWAIRSAPRATSASTRAATAPG